MKKDQDFLRRQVKLVKAYNSDWNYKNIAQVISVTDHAFYNWLHGYYDLSDRKAAELLDLVCNLLDQEGIY